MWEWCVNEWIQEPFKDFDYILHRGKLHSCTIVSLAYSWWKILHACAILVNCHPASNLCHKIYMFPFSLIALFLCRNNLILRGSVELTDLVPHPLSEIVLQLEYVIQWSGPVAYKLEQKLASCVLSGRFSTSSSTLSLLREVKSLFMCVFFP